MQLYFCEHLMNEHLMCWAKSKWRFNDPMTLFFMVYLACYSLDHAQIWILDRASKLYSIPTFSILDRASRLYSIPTFSTGGLRGSWTAAWGGGASLTVHSILDSLHGSVVCSTCFSESAVDFEEEFVTREVQVYGQDHIVPQRIPLLPYRTKWHYSIWGWINEVK
jgi:hypothetical protein